MREYYILDGHIAKEEPDLLFWSKWMGNNADARNVAKTHIGKDILVSTVFLGLNHSYVEGELLLFETLVFGGERDGETHRYATWDEAVVGHKDMVDSFEERCIYCGTLRKCHESECSSCGSNF